MIETTINERFSRILKKEKLSQKIFAKTTGIPEKTVSNNARDPEEGGNKEPKASFFQAIAIHYPHWNLRWLLTGEGEMYGEGRGVALVAGEERRLHEKIGELVMEKDELVQQLGALLLAVERFMAWLGSQEGTSEAYRQEAAEWRASLAGLLAKYGKG